MEKMILSLKNIYMTLMTEDFPIYSESVIGRNERKGQTMLRFWQGQIVPEFRCMPCGKMIWRNDGKRNRYTSYLCNRSGEIKTYAEYARELNSQISEASLLNQISRFTDFLSGRKYRHDILLRRIRELVRLTEAEDPRFSPEIGKQILEAASWQPGSVQGNLFLAGYLLTLMTLYAASGEMMDDPVMAVLREEKYSVQKLWEAFLRPADEDSAEVSFLTIHSGILQDNPLPRHSFFGREEELFNLKEMASSRRKCLITGIGGIGKTELLRQLIRRCCEEKLVDKIAVVPYENGIMESFIRCFPGGHQQKPEDGFRRILHQLQQESRQGKILLLIDNLTGGMEEDPELEMLNSLDCAVLITTRRSSLAGYEAYALDAPTVRTGSLIFRDNYGSPLRAEDQLILAEMLAEESLCNPLTLRLMARAARSRDWSVQELKAQLSQKIARISWQEEDQTLRLTKIYRQLYSYTQIPKECHALAELFTLLPRDSYSAAFLEKWFPAVTDGALSERLESLAANGWLDRDEQGWSMHPFVAQCLRKTVLTEANTEQLFQTIRQTLTDMGPSDAPEYEEEEFQRISGIYRCYVSLLGGNVSSPLVHAYANAVSTREFSMADIDRFTAMMERLEKRCPDMDDGALAAVCAVLCRWRRGDVEQVKAVYFRQKQSRTISDARYFNLCLGGGFYLQFQHENELAEEMFRQVLDGNADPVQVGTAYFYMYQLSVTNGDYLASAQWGREGAAYVQSHPECGNAVTFTCLFAMGASNLKYSKEYAREAMQKMEAMLKKYSPSWCKAQYASLASAYELNYGSLEAALEHILWQRDYVLEFQGKNYHYYNVLVRVASVLGKLERYPEAEQTYNDIIGYARENGQGAMYQMACCNMAQLYLSWKKPTQALEYAGAAVDEGRKLGGMALGVALKYRGDAYHQLGKPEQEMSSLQEALPLLESGYGPAHPHTVSARERLAELET